MDDEQKRKTDPPPTRHGRNPFDVISALQKAARRGQPEQAAAFAIELVQSGYGAWCWSRLKVIACEDVSPQETGLVADIDALADQWKAATKGRDLDLLTVARAAVALALTRKSRVVDWLVLLHAPSAAEPVAIPEEAYDMHTRTGRRMNRGRHHFAEEASRLVPWTGDLETWEADVRERALAGWLADPDSPPDPVENGPEAPQAGEPAPQLALDDDEGER